MDREDGQAGSPQSVNAAARAVGAADLFVFRRVHDERFVHVGGLGRGVGWAGIVEVLLADEPLFRQAVATGQPVRVESVDAQRLFGPYYGTSAAAVAVSADVVIVFGQGGTKLAACEDGALRAAAEVASAAIEHVSPAKRLADELEVLHAVRALMLTEPGSVHAAMNHVAEVVVDALSCELAIAYLREGDRLVVVERGWPQPVSRTALARTVAELMGRSDLPVAQQDCRPGVLPDPLSTDFGVRAAYVLPLGSPPIGLLIAAHTDASPRGFSTLCKELGLRAAEAAETLMRSLLLRDRLERQFDEASSRARQDCLTGVGNRLAWEEALAAEESRRGIGGGSSAVLLADLDGLKGVNDDAGHATGDRILQEFAQLLGTTVRGQDVVARLGGDEFGVLLPDTDEAECLRVRDRILAMLAAHPTVAGHPLAAGIGHACCPPEPTLQEAANVADRRMYARKRQVAAPAGPTRGAVPTSTCG